MRGAINVLMIYDAVVAFAFVAQIVRGRRWRESPAGRALTGLALVLAILLALVVGQPLTGHRFPDWVWFGGLATLGVMLSELLFLVLRPEGENASPLTRIVRKVSNMSAWVYSALRTGAQVLWGLIVTRAAALGITLPDWAQQWFVETVVVAGAIAIVTAALRWLETRQGDSVGARAARWLARVLMLGLGGKQPVYAPPASAGTGAPVTAVTYQDGTAKAVTR